MEHILLLGIAELLFPLVPIVFFLLEQQLQQLVQSKSPSVLLKVLTEDMSFILRRVKVHIKWLYT